MAKQIETLDKNLILGEIDRNNRVFFGPANDILPLLKSYCAAVISEENYYCDNLPQNFIGSLLLQQHLNEFSEVFKNLNYSPSRSISQPVKLIERGLLFYANDQGDQIKPVIDHQLNHVAVESVLIKQACGIEVGLVLEGLLAGLFVYQAENQDSSFIIERFWNDYPLMSIDSQGDILRRNYYRLDFEDEHIETDIGEALNNLLYQKFLRLLSPNILASTVFLDLLKKTLGIQLEYGQFNHSRSKNLQQPSK